MGKRLKVLYDHQIFSVQDFGGISKCFAMYAKEFTDISLNVDACINAKFSGNHHLGEFFPGSFHKVSEFPGSIRTKLLLNRASSMFRSHKMDIFHPTFYFDWGLPREGGIPMVATVHDMIPEIFPEMFPGGNPHLAKKDYVKRASMVVCVSERTRQDLIGLYGIPKDITRVVYHGIDLGGIEKKYKKKQGLPCQFLLYVGKRGGYKNFSLLLEAFKILSRSCPGLHLVCAGGGAFDKDESKTIGGGGTGNRVHQISATDMELRYLYKVASAFVFPSIYEGFGIPVLEAFAQNCPVVLADTSCFPEIAGEAAVYFDPTEAESCAGAIERVLAGNNKPITALGYKRAKDFSWRRAVEGLSKIYGQVAR